MLQQLSCDLLILCSTEDDVLTVVYPWVPSGCLDISMRKVRREGVTTILVCGLEFSPSSLRFSAERLQTTRHHMENNKPEWCFIQAVRTNQCAGTAARCLWCCWGTSGFLGPKPSVLVISARRPSTLFRIVCLDKADWFALNPVIHTQLFSWCYSARPQHQGRCHKRGS